MLGDDAQLERAPVAERTKAGLRARDPTAICKARSARDTAHLAAVLAGLDAWLPTVRRIRPRQPWGDVARVLNQAGPGRGGSAKWTPERLRRTVRRLAAEGIVEAGLLGRAPPRVGDDRPVALVGGTAAAAPGTTLQRIAA